jgi:hypothetical protein
LKEYLSEKIFSDPGRKMLHETKFHLITNRVDFFSTITFIKTYIFIHIVKGSSDIESELLISDGNEDTQFLHADYPSTRAKALQNRNNRNWSVLVPTCNKYGGLWFENVGSNTEHVKPVKGDLLLFEGWCQHKGIKANGHVVRLFFYITGYLSWKVENTEFAGTSLSKVFKCYIKDSTIPGAGKGVFANRNIEKGSIVTFYEYEDVSKKVFTQSNSDKRIFVDGNYCIGFTVKHTDCIGYGSMINRGTKLTNNCKYYYYRPNRRIYIRALCNIYKDQELFMSYGIGYRMPCNFNHQIADNTSGGVSTTISTTSSIINVNYDNDDDNDSHIFHDDNDNVVLEYENFKDDDSDNNSEEWNSDHSDKLVEYQDMDFKEFSE